jgi:hypothetical protein
LYEDVDSLGEELSGEFDLRPKGSSPQAAAAVRAIDFRVVGPDEALMYENHGAASGRFGFAASAIGQHRLCFYNMPSSLAADDEEESRPRPSSDAIFRGRLDVVREDAHAMGRAIARGEHLSPLEESVQRISDKLNAVQAEQRFMRQRERKQRDLLRGTNSKIIFWSLVEIVVFALLLLGQLQYLHRLFDVKV